MNPQDRTALAIAATLAASGVRHVVASPGSRHTPLLLALDNHPNLSVSVHHDERVVTGLDFTGPAVAAAMVDASMSERSPGVISFIRIRNINTQSGRGKAARGGREPRDQQISTVPS